ncbi:phosphatase PAP2 family protein [Mucilaginibacter segetis]|uniref:Phosphatase PAP2 family protein n=1 Tax=Mucilaginibacter segetis TaxID=2793071 RepID=A0A934UP21_9SPHI|nr:phosphatase PAP2 family protein [Mucilaginibacter segetis]MBK0380527.1 phosphatase PAP2 family protein [Mucilaginibacter segetis]
MNTGAKDVLYRNRYFFLPYLIILCACIIIKVLYTRETIFFAVNARYSNWADIVMPYVTYIGDGIAIIIIAIVLLFYSYRSSFLLITGYIITSVVAQILKYSFDMPRPKVYFSAKLDQIHFVKDMYILSTHSFPSGHTVTAFSAGMVLTYLVKNKLWGALFLVIAVLVGFSRIYLSQHFFEDVLAGSVIGTVVTVLWLSWIDRRPFLQTSRWNRGLLSRRKL